MITDRILNLGDSGLILPLGLIFIFIMASSIKHFFILICSFIGLFVAVSILKLLYMVCGSGLSYRPFSASGHSAVSFFFYSMFFFFLFGQFIGRVISIFLGLGVAVFIGILLVGNNSHTPLEVVTGLIIGGLFVVPVIMFSVVKTMFSFVKIAVVAILILGNMYISQSHHNRMPSEIRLRETAQYLRSEFSIDRFCPIGHPLLNGKKPVWM